MSDLTPRHHEWRVVEGDRRDDAITECRRCGTEIGAGRSEECPVRLREALNEAVQIAGAHFNKICEVTAELEAARAEVEALRARCAAWETEWSDHRKRCHGTHRFVHPAEREGKKA